MQWANVQVSKGPKTYEPRDNRLDTTFLLPCRRALTTLSFPLDIASSSGAETYRVPQESRVGHFYLLKLFRKLKYDGSYTGMMLPVYRQKNCGHV